ncbi:MAG TPA: MazG-like family protein [Microlunatus sp.]
MSLDEICENVRQLSSEHGWDQVDPMSRMLHVTAEVGEVAHAVISLQATAKGHSETARLALGHEIFDAIWNLCALATAAGVDIEQAARDKMAINAERVWPSDSAK